MRKLLLIIGAGILVMLMSIPAYAVDISFGGLLRTRYIAQNFPTGAGVGLRGTGASSTDHGYSFFDQRIDISMTAKISDDLKGVIVLTNSSNSMHPLSFPVWGRNGVNRSSNNAPTAATSSGGTPAHTHTYYIDDTTSTFFGELNFRNYYVDFNLPNPCLPLNLKVGRQQLKIGHGFVFSGSPDAISLTSKYKNINYGFFTAMISEGSVTEADDWNMYTLWANFSPKPNHTLGASFIYEYGKSGSFQQMTSYGAPVTLATFSEDTKFRPWIIDLTADGKIDPITYRAEFAYMGGEIKDAFGDDTDDVDLSAWAIMAGLDYNLSSISKKPAKVGVEFAYGSGEEDGIRGNYNGFLMHDPEWWYADLMSDVIGLYLLNGLNNRAYIKLSGEMKPLDKLTCNFAYLYNWAPETNSEGRYEGHHNFMGHEFDLGATYDIYKNLSFELKAAYLVAGDFFNDPDGDSPTDPYGITGTLLFKF
jgi:hypothetical protein